MPRQPHRHQRRCRQWLYHLRGVLLVLVVVQCHRILISKAELLPENFRQSYGLRSRIWYQICRKFMSPKLLSWREARIAYLYMPNTNILRCLHLLVLFDGGRNFGSEGAHLRVG